MKEVYGKASLSVIFFENCDDVITTSTKDPYDEDMIWDQQA